MENYLEAYNSLNLYEKKDILNLILQNDVMVFYEGSRELVDVEDLDGCYNTCVNGTKIQITLVKDL